MFVIFGVAMTTLSCSFTATTAVTPTQMVDEAGTSVAATMQSLPATPGESIPTQAATEPGGISVSYENVSFVIPNGTADGANAETMTAVESNSEAPWDIAPTHLRFTLTGYQLQNKFHGPRVFVFPADEYAQVNPTAAEQIDRLRKISAGGALLQETLPSVPFFNATPQIAANIKIIPMQNGSGVRFLTQYAQYLAPINNRELFYHFQGLSDDGRHYIIAVLPITAPILPEDEKPEASIPEGGVPIPTDVGPNNAYYFSVTEKLNSLSPDAFTPSLNSLDTMIQSILVTNP
jgi:hypothetical protein